MVVVVNEKVYTYLQFLYVVKLDIVSTFLYRKILMLKDTYLLFKAKFLNFSLEVVATQSDKFAKKKKKIGSLKDAEAGVFLPPGYRICLIEM